MAFLGTADLVHEKEKQSGLQRRSAKRDLHVLDAGAAIIIGWPETFYALAGKVTSARSHLRGFNVTNPIRSFVARNVSRPFGPALPHAYRCFLSLNEDLSDAKRRNQAKDPMPSMEFVERLKVRHILGMSPKAIAALKREPMWAPVQAAIEGTGTYMVYPKQQLEMLAARLSGLISFREADRLLGLTDRETGGKVSQLVDDGILESIPFNPNQGVRLPTVYREAVTGLLASIEQCVSKSSPVEPLTFKGMLQIFENQCTPKIALFVLFRLLIAGKIRGFVSFDDAVGVKRLSFEHADVDRAILEIGRNPAE